MGEFVNNQIEGFGIEKWNDSDSYYIGNYIQQIKKGYGIFVLNNNLSYEGEFNDNNFNGYGTLIINKDILVKGFFTNNYIDKYNVFYENIHENKIYEGEFLIFLNLKVLEFYMKIIVEKFLLEIGKEIN